LSFDFAIRFRLSSTLLPSMSASIASVRGVLFFLRRPGQVLSFFAALAVAILYVWYAAVRAVPGVRRRKAASRAQRRRSWKD
jgi:hypothetical protein